MCFAVLHYIVFTDIICWSLCLWLRQHSKVFSNENTKMYGNACNKQVTLRSRRRVRKMRIMIKINAEIIHNAPLAMPLTNSCLQYCQTRVGAKLMLIGIIWISYFSVRRCTISSLDSTRRPGPWKGTRMLPSAQRNREETNIFVSILPVWWWDS